jgi:hypothetical protein
VLGSLNYKSLFAALTWSFLIYQDSEQAQSSYIKKARYFHTRLFGFVGVAGFEPTTSSSRTTRATGLRYTPFFKTFRSLQSAANLNFFEGNKIFDS